MSFIYRFGIAVVIAAVLPVFVINYSYPSAYETHLLVTLTVVWLLMLPLSMYSSPTVPIHQDTDGNPAPAFLKEARFRALIGRCIVLASVSIYLAFLFFATYAFAQKYDVLILGPVIALGPIGAYFYGTPMCPYCKKLNRPNLRECENCANTLLPHFLQERSG